MPFLEIISLPRPHNEHRIACVDRKCRLGGDDETDEEHVADMCIIA